VGFSLLIAVVQYEADRLVLVADAQLERQLPSGERSSVGNEYQFEHEEGRWRLVGLPCNERSIIIVM
jgi:hypothetical protein